MDYVIVQVLLKNPTDSGFIREFTKRICPEISSEAPPGISSGVPPITPSVFLVEFLQYIYWYFRESFQQFLQEFFQEFRWEFHQILQIFTSASPPGISLGLHSIICSWTLLKLCFPGILSESAELIEIILGMFRKFQGSFRVRSCWCLYQRYLRNYI